MNFTARFADGAPGPLAIVVAALLALALAALLAGCDPQRIKELEEGVSTEADVRAKFGQPENIWDGPGGEKIFEYNRQPSGHVNYMIGIGPDGKMTALRQVLNERNFGKVQPGMMMEDVRKLLGKPMKQVPYALKNQIAWDWRYMEPPNTSMVFTVYFSPDMRVVSTSTQRDPEAPENR
jgi:outer membrane protein assembly factor BamE (lipoprotein component of BamABCDE complex)